jgi:hypothetical protein
MKAHGAKGRRADALGFAPEHTVTLFLPFLHELDRSRIMSDPSNSKNLQADRSALTDEQLMGLYGPLPRRETPFLLILKGRKILVALTVLIALGLAFGFGR